jgi:hypothetical protein
LRVSQARRDDTCTDRAIVLRAAKRMIGEMGMSVNTASHHDEIIRVNYQRGVDRRIGDFPVADVNIPPDEPLPIKRVNDQSVFYQQSIHQGRPGLSPK